MIRICNGTDRNLISEDGTTPCACGLVFDDVDRLVIYPHTPFGRGAVDVRGPTRRQGRVAGHNPALWA